MERDRKERWRVKREGGREGARVCVGAPRMYSLSRIYDRANTEGGLYCQHPADRLRWKRGSGACAYSMFDAVVVVVDVVDAVVNSVAHSPPLLRRLHHHRRSDIFTGHTVIFRTKPAQKWTRCDVIP